MRRAINRSRRCVTLVALVAAVTYALPTVALAAEETHTAVVTLPAGAQVAGLAVAAGAVWVANGRLGTIARMDPSTERVVAMISIAEPLPTCDRCWGAAAGRGDAVWATMNSAGPVVARIDPASNDITETVEVGVLPSALAVDEDGKLWLAATLEDAVVRVDPHVPGAIARTSVHLPAGIVAGQDAIWVTARKPGVNGQLVRIDRRTGVVWATIPVGHDPGALAVADKDVWVANEADHTISRIDARTNTVAATIPVVHFPVGLAIGVDAVWVASRGSALLSAPALSRIDPDSNTVVETTPLEGTAPIGMAAGAGSLWVASRDPDEVVRIGPVALPAGPLAASGPPLVQVVLGVGTIFLLAGGEVLWRSAHRVAQRRVPDGSLLGALLLLRPQASHRAGARERPPDVR
jgi:YVTN family beta-propeller protein